MKTSESIKEITKALFKAQGEAVNPSKSSQGYNYTYADLPNVLGCIEKALRLNELSVVQSSEVDNGNYYLATRLIHTSGEWIETYTPMLVPPEHITDKKTGESYVRQPDMQDMGGAVTYARRYALQALFNICAEKDDDCARKSKQSYQSPKQEVKPMSSLDLEVNDLVSALNIVQTPEQFVHLKNQCSIIKHKLDDGQANRLGLAVKSAMARTESKI